MDTKLAAKQVNSKKKKLWRRNSKWKSHCFFPLHFFVSFYIKILKHLTKLSVEHIYAFGNLFHMLNTIYFKIFACTVSLFSISSFLNYTLFFIVWIRFILFPFRTLNPLFLFFFFLSFHCLLLCNVFFCLADQVPLSSLKLKGKVSSIYSTQLSENSKVHEKNQDLQESLPLHYGGAHRCGAGRTSWQEGLACTQPRQAHIYLYPCRQGCPGTHLPLSQMLRVWVFTEALFCTDRNPALVNRQF